MSSAQNGSSLQKESAILHRTPFRPIIATRGEGIYLYTEDGRKLLDAVGGAAVASIGSGHPKVLQAIKDQVDELTYVYNMQLSNGPAEDLAQKLIDTSDGAFSKVCYAAGGSEAMDGVLKLARQYFVGIDQPERVNFIGRQSSFHGNTLATLSVAYHPTRRALYVPLLEKDHFHHVSPAYAKRYQRPDETEEQYVERLRQELEDKFQALGPNTVIGFVAETVVGATTGVVPAPKGYFKAMKSVCDKYGALFILDEVMSGMGRMGTLHAWQSFGDGAAPDIQAIAKGLSGGYASLGAILVSPKVAEGITRNGGFLKQGHTFQAHPISCVAALAVQEVVESENLLENIRTQGSYFGKLLSERLAASSARPFVFDVRGGGGFWAVEFDFENPHTASYDFKGKAFSMVVQEKAFDNGLIVMGMSGGASLDGSRGDTAIFAPAYNVTKEEIETIVDLFIKSLEDLLSAARVQ